MRHITRFSLVILTILLLVAAPFADVKQAIKGGITTANLNVLVISDSDGVITYETNYFGGPGIPSSTWPDQFKTALEAAYPGTTFTIINKSVAGEASGAVLNGDPGYMDPLLTNLQNYNPDIVIIGIGTNDAAIYNNQTINADGSITEAANIDTVIGTANANYAANMRAIAQQVLTFNNGSGRNGGQPVLLFVTPPPAAQLADVNGPYPNDIANQATTPTHTIHSKQYTRDDRILVPAVATCKNLGLEYGFAAYDFRAGVLAVQNWLNRTSDGSTQLIFDGVHITNAAKQILIVGALEALDPFLNAAGEPSYPDAQLGPLSITMNAAELIVSGQAAYVKHGENPLFHYRQPGGNWHEPAVAGAQVNPGIWQARFILTSLPNSVILEEELTRGGQTFRSPETAEYAIREDEPPPDLSFVVSDAARVGLHMAGGFFVSQFDGFKYGQEFPSIVTDEDLTVYNEDDEPAVILTEAGDVAIDSALGGVFYLEFTHPAAGEKYAEIQGERRITYQGHEFVIEALEDEHASDGSLLVKVSAPVNAIYDLNSVRNLSLTLEDATLAVGLATILQGSGYSVGIIDVAEPDKRRSLVSDEQTVLANGLEWIKMHGAYPTYTSQEKKINALDVPGASNGLELRLEKNVTDVTREIDYSEMVTRLYVYGADDLTVAEANPTGLPYIQNFDWYIGRGWTLEEIEADIAANGKGSRFIKEDVVHDANYTDATALYTDYVAKLAEMAKPRISYSVKIVDLSGFVDYSHEQINLGDTVRLIDEALGIDTLQYITRHKYYPNEPWRDEIALATARPTFSDEALKNARAVEIVTQQAGRWGNAADAVIANIDDWSKAAGLNPDGTIPFDLIRGIWSAAYSAINAGVNESVTIDEYGITIAENTVVQDHGANGAAGTFGAATQMVGGYDPRDIKLTWKVNRYIRMTGGAVTLQAGEGLPIKTAITPDGILAPAILIDNSNPLTPNGEAVFIDERGLIALDTVAERYVRISSGYITMRAGAAYEEKVAITPDGIRASSFIVNNLEPIEPEGSPVVIDAMGVTAYDPADATKYVRMANGQIKFKNGALAAELALDATGLNITAEHVTQYEDQLSINVSQLVAGTLDVSGDITISADSRFVSSNYSAGSAGFVIDGDGSFELNEGTVRAHVHIGDANNYIEILRDPNDSNNAHLRMYRYYNGASRLQLDIGPNIDGGLRFHDTMGSYCGYLKGAVAGGLATDNEFTAGSDIHAGEDGLGGWLYGDGTNEAILTANVGSQYTEWPDTSQVNWWDSGVYLGGVYMDF